MAPPKDEVSHWDDLFRLVDENEELEKETAAAETSTNFPEGAEQNPSSRVVPARPTPDSLRSWILLASIPITLFLILGFLGLKAYFDLSASIRGIQAQIAQPALEAQPTQTEQTEEASSELRLEHTKLSQKLVAAQALSAKLEQQLAARGQGPQPERRIANMQTSAQGPVTPPKKEDEPREPPQSRARYALGAQGPEVARIQRRLQKEDEPREPPQSRARYALGAQGPEVARIQRRLQELGYYTEEADGVFDRNTRHAVRAFQRSERLRPDGVVGGKTLKKLLFKDLAW